MASRALEILLLGSFVLTVLPFPLLNHSSTCEKTQVVILGAGVAGITAAVRFASHQQFITRSCQQSLTNNSVHDFLIVEYNSKRGGRCRHALFGKDRKGDPCTVELGDNWVCSVNFLPNLQLKTFVV